MKWFGDTQKDRGTIDENIKRLIQLGISEDEDGSKLENRLFIIFTWIEDLLGLVGWSGPRGALALQ
jgi:hypothetical protein